MSKKDNACNMPSLEEASIEGAKDIEERILFVLSVYPTISPSMLQISLGSGLPTKMWHHVLDKLIQERKVFRGSTARTRPNGRQQTLQFISLFPPVSSAISDAHLPSNTLVNTEAIVDSNIKISGSN